MTNRIVKYAEITAIIGGLSGAYYCNNRLGDDFNQREAAQKELEERLIGVENNSETREADNQRHAYSLAMFAFVVIGVTPIFLYGKREELQNILNLIQHHH